MRWLLLFDFFETETVRVGVEIKEINKRFTIIITKELSLLPILVAAELAQS